MKVEQVRTPGPELAKLPPVRVGRVPAGVGTPELHLLVERENGERLRIDLYADRAREAYFATGAIAWNGWIAVGFGYAAYLVDPGTGDTRAVELPFYFDRFVASEQWLLAVSGAGITRIGPRGEVEWENRSVAVDGVHVHDVENGVISGSAELDPPGGWRPFRLDLATGRPLPADPS